jgi:DNA-binding XRE family transcriptional regulator
MARKNKKELEAKLGPKKVHAALLVVEEMLGEDVDSIKTQEEIAAEIGVSRMTLYRWRTQDADFIAYVNILAGQFLTAKTGQVFRSLMRGINAQQPSMRGIELFLKVQGLLKEHQIVETVDGGKRSKEEITKSLDEIDDLLNDNFDEDDDNTDTIGFADEDFDIEE